MSGVKLPRSLVNGYASGTLIGGIYSTLPGLLLLPYLTDLVNVGPLLAGMLMLAPSLWIAIVTPLLGRWSDKATGRWGERQVWLIAAGGALALTFALTMTTPLPSGSIGLVVVVAFLLLLSATCYAAFQSSYIAAAAELTSSEHQRTRLAARRIGVLAVTTLTVGALGPAVLSAVPGADGYRVVGVAAGTLMVCGAAISGRAVRSAATRHRQPVQTTSGVRWALRVPAMRMLLANYALQGLGTGASLAGLIFVATYALHDTAIASLVFVFLFVAMFLAIPVWERISRRLTKRRCLAVGTIVYVAATLPLLAIRALPHTTIFALAALIGVGFAALQVFPSAMLPDVTGAAAIAAGRPMSAGVFAGLWTAVETGSVAAGAVLFSVTLGAGGYHAAVNGMAIAQSPAAVDAIVFGFAGIPALFLTASLVPLAMYRPTEQGAA